MLRLALFLIFQTLALGQEWVLISHPGNAADKSGFGAVSYEFEIMKHEVTCAEYAEFLNSAAAKEDPPALWNPKMDGAPLPTGRDDIRSEQGCLIREGEKGSFRYSVVPGREEIPIVNVSFINALRFANWKHGGSTETGAYDITKDKNLASRSQDARYWLPSEDEWHKAAYFDPEAKRYWLYATRSDARPNSRKPDASDTNAANFVWIDRINNGMNKGYAFSQSDYYKPGAIYLFPVGSYPSARSAYGTLDQSGSVWEWTEGLMWETKRVLRGGSWFDEANALRSTTRCAVPPERTYHDTGFRLCRKPTQSEVQR